jgi:tellurite resistance protein
MANINVEELSPIETAFFPLMTIIASDGIVTPEEKNDVMASFDALYGEGGVFPEITYEDALADVKMISGYFNLISDFKSKVVISLQCCKKLNQIIDHEDKKNVVASYLIDAAKADGEIDDTEDQLLKIFCSLIINGKI